MADQIDTQNHSKTKQGKRNRAAGRRFESKVRADLEEQGWIVAKWTNSVEFNQNEGKLIAATKWKFNPFTKTIMAVGTGFPDFIAYRTRETGYEVVGVECKSNGYLDKAEKEKCVWLLQNRVFSQILIARKGKKRGELVYQQFTS